MKDLSLTTARTWATGSALVMYACSLACPVFTFSGHAPVIGLDVLVLGWLGLLFGPVSWFANLFLPFTIWALFKDFRLARYLSIAACGLALTSLTTTKWWFNEGSSTEILRFGSGLYLWLGCFLILLVACLLFPRLTIVRADAP
jgi:hypothetical protein